MNSQTLGKLERVTDLRNTWPREDRDFSRWITQEDTMLMLSEATSIDIRFTERESPVNNLSVDILATDAETNKAIVIENQLEDSDFNHLGKTITYAAGKKLEQ